jgi:hypothetical protein
LPIKDLEVLAHFETRLDVEIEVAAEAVVLRKRWTCQGALGPKYHTKEGQDEKACTEA